MTESGKGSIFLPNVREFDEIGYVFWKFKIKNILVVRELEYCQWKKSETWR
jgi:hypothetical protein